MVDRKTVERWIGGRMPYKRYRYDLAALLGADPGYLWPAESAGESSDLALAEVVAIYPVRATVPNQTWIDLFEHAEQQIDVLVYAGFWLSEDPAVRKVLQRKTGSGVKIRMLLGDPTAMPSTSGAWTKGSPRPYQPRSETRFTTTGSCESTPESTSVSMTPCSTTRFTEPTTRCWLTTTCTACLPT
jgi:hypothetical protein